MKILIAPNSFKECASSVDISNIITKELDKYHLGELTQVPVSDGGDGFLEVCRRIFKLKIRNYKVNTCYNESSYTVRTGLDYDRQILYVESADIIGLKTIPLQYRKPTLINSGNFGELIKKIYRIHRGLKALTIGLGGTGTSDLGLGIAGIFGLRLYDKSGAGLPILPKFYKYARQIILPEKLNLRVNVIMDVSNPLFGGKGTSYTYATQKGADKKELAVLEAGVKNILSILKKNHNLDFYNEMIGAGGGLALGLSLISGVKLTMSQQFILDQLGLKESIKNSDAVITGEGNLDEQSFMNKATGIIIDQALKYNKHIFLLVGTNKSYSAKLAKSNVKIFELKKLYKSEKDSIRYYAQGLKTYCGRISDYLLSLK
ncbi:MAG: glycerate kinase [Melioribacteraceae bacterium]|nr:glycerate kinase [Melioribacteraceae bacterium]